MRVRPFLLFALITMPTVAQPQAFDGFAGGVAMQNLYNRQLRQRVERGNSNFESQRARASVGLLSLAAPDSGHGPKLSDTATRLTYQPTTALQREQQQAMIGRLQSKNPEAARALSEQFSRHNFQQIYRGLTTPFGLRDNDTADILTAYTALSYLIATGSPDPSPQAVRSLRAQIAPKLAANPQLATPTTRAELGEELKILFVTLHAGWQSARREGPGALDRYSDGVARLFQQQGGADLRQVRLTDSGFVKQ